MPSFIVRDVAERLDIVEDLLIHTFGYLLEWLCYHSFVLVTLDS